MSIDSIIQEAVARAVASLYGIKADATSIVPQATRKEFEGNLTIVVFPWVKAARKAPEAVGKEIGDWLTANEPAVKGYNVVKGFLNIVIEPTYFTAMLRHMAADSDFGFRKAGADSPLAMVEYSSPNTNKPLHLGHMRNNLLGYSLSRILSACGNRVVKTNIVNDRGIHICKSMLAWQKWGEGVTPEKAGKKGDHLIGDFYVLFDKHYKEEVKALVAGGMGEEEAKNAAPLMQEAREMLRRWEQKDPEVRALWAMMNEWVYAGFDETYKRLGVDFDKIYYESETYLEGKDKVLEGLEKGIMYRKEDGSVWADLTDAGLDHKLLLRSDGTSVYMTQDIGTAKLRYQDFPIDKMIYVVGNEGGRGDMSPEEADEVARIVGMGALKYFLLKVDPRKNMTFNPKESIDFNGNTGPFIQYTYARIRSVLRKAAESGIAIEGYDTVEPNEKETSLIQHLADFPALVAEAGRSYSPALVANYVYELVKEYNQFYHDCTILNEPDTAVRAMRLALSALTADVVRRGMWLLGIEVPERM